MREQDLQGPIGILGAGAWGTALAATAARAGRPVRLWAREPEVVEEVNSRARNSAFLPDVDLPSGIEATDLLSDLNACALVLVVTPAQHVRDALGNLAIALDAPVPVLLCAKGIEAATGNLMSEIADDVLPGWPVGVLSGPTFAPEVARGHPCAITVACPDRALGTALAQVLGQELFRPYLSDDILGAQVGGAVKNVLAIACGVVHGLDLGENARAALITRGMAEMVRFGLARGARAETLMGLSGLGDLILTCSSLQSRNMSFGAALGRGEASESVLASRTSVAEGVYTARILAQLASRLGVDMPIVTAVCQMIYEERAVGDIMADLLARPFKSETR